MKVNTRDVDLCEAVKKFLKTKKRTTANSYRASLRRFVVFYGKDLESFIREVERRRLENMDLPVVERERYAENVAREWIEWHKEKGYAPKTINVALAALQNLLQYYQLPLSFRFIEKPPDRPLKINEKHKWSLEEVKKFVDSARYLRDKAFLLCQFQSGIGIGDMVKLDYGDVKKELTSGKLPLLLTLDRKKTGVEFKTFFGRDAVKYLKMYLKTREPLRKSYPLFAKLGSRERVTAGAIEMMARRLAERMPFIDEEDLEEGWNPARPHSLRSAFNSRLTGKVDRTLIEFWMGHHIGEEKRAYLNLPDEELREQYANHEHLLTIEKTSLDEEKETVKIDEETKQRLEDLENALNHVTKNNQELRNQQKEWDKRMTNIEKEFREIRLSRRRLHTTR